MKLKTWTFGRRITVGFFLVLALASTAAVVGLVYLRKTGAMTRLIAQDCLPGTALTGRVAYNTGEIQLAVLRHFLDEDPAGKQKEEELIATLRAETLGALAEYELTVTLPEDRALLDSLRKNLDAYVAVRNRALAISREQTAADALAYNRAELRPVYATYQASVADLLRFNVERGRTLGAKSQSDSAQAIWITTVCLGIAILAGIGIAVWMVLSVNRILHKLAGSLSQGSTEIVSAADQVAASSQTLARDASSQAAALEETSSSLEEISSMTKRNAEHAQAAKDTATQTRKAAETGLHTMTRMSQAMLAINASGESVSKVVKTIDEIAFQTNILALNAAVEAARAGDAGAGFAVVADEVRALAQRSALAAKETASLISDSMSKSRDGLATSSEVAHSLEQLGAEARKVDELIAEIAQASSEQANGVAQVLLAISQMDKTTQSVAANAEEGAAAAEELNAQAGSLKEIVVEMERLVQAEKKPRPLAKA